MSKKNNSALKCVFKENDFNSADGMLTYVWGPSLWHFLHTMSFNYPVKPTREDKMNYLNFMNSLKGILPCKYCRRSYIEYLEKLPVENHVSSRNSLCFWLYKVHNMVSGKLRGQGHLHEKDPTYKSVRQTYKKLLKDPKFVVGKKAMNFLCSIVFNYPVKQKYDPYKRLYYEVFFDSLVKVIPDKKFVKLYTAYNKRNPLVETLCCRQLLKKWFYKLKCKNVSCKDKKSYKSYCHSFEHYRSKGCEKKSHKGNTCRKKKRVTLHLRAKRLARNTSGTLRRV